MRVNFLVLPKVVLNSMAHMLKAARNDLRCYPETEDGMEIIFVTTKSIIASRENNILIEVKFDIHHLMRLLGELRNKYLQQIEKLIVLCDGDVLVDDETNTFYSPVCMAELI